RGADGSLARYRLRLAPWTHALTLRRDSYVFQDKTVLEIIEEVLQDYPAASYRFDVGSALPSRSLAMQYRETDYDFITRLLAEEGFNFFFEHEDAHERPEATPRRKDADTASEPASAHARHRFVVFDDNARLKPCTQPSIRFQRAAATEASDTITLLRQGRQAQANAAALGSWDYRTLAAAAAEDSVISSCGDMPPLEIFEGAGAYRYTDAGESQRIARSRIESLALAQQTMQAESAVRALAVGSWFSLTDHPDADGDYLVLSIRHQGANNLSAHTAALADRPGAEHGTYRNQFGCVPRAMPVRPAYWLPKPLASGTQVALVVGIDGEEITTERDHRIKVQFPWQRGDRAAAGQLPHPATSNAPGNDTAGTWVRVAEPHAGANWGAHFLPRIGQEVCVDFIAGDIDRPVVVGQLYNGADTPPLHGADNHPGALGGIKSKEYAGSGYNQWLLDDTPGQLRQALASTAAASQLNLGYLIRQNGNTRSAWRGAGFELATDAWSTLRARRGLFLSTAQRAGAISTQLDTQEAQGRLKTAGELAQALSDAAQEHRALPLSTPSGLRQLGEALAAGDEADGQQVPRFAQPTALLDSQAGIEATTPASLIMLAGQDLTMTATSSLRVSAGQATSIVAARATSLFTHAGGAKLVAAQAPVSLRAHAGAMEVTAQQAMTITSSHAGITVQSKQDILLASGGGYIKLSGGNIDIHCPAGVSVKGGTHSFLGAGSKTPALPVLPDATMKDPPHWIALHYLDPETAEGIGEAGYDIHFEGGPVVSGTLDKDGKARHENVMNKPVKKVVYKPRPPKEEKVADPLEALNNA
ncbi:MAG TPA: type VI secretion system Vgr family protein, partial [Noviherbaspirillum sp.]|nr:type VI secretion system Vgr family protein [Noviherbaspirillum sp.]